MPLGNVIWARVSTGYGVGGKLIHAPGVLRAYQTLARNAGRSIRADDSPAGAFPSGKLGEEPRGRPGNLLPLLAQMAVGREKSDLKVFGNDFPTP